MTPVNTPDPGAIRAQLDRIVASAAFAGSDRMSRLLRYLVERTLAGEAAQLKEYVLGVEVFDRDQRYDPRLDSIVRVEARRLRAKIEEYYGGPGAGDTILITIPKGSYVPAFDTRPAPVATVAATPALHSDAAAPEPAPPGPPRRATLKGGVAMGTLAAAVLVMVVGAAWRDRPAAPAVVEASGPLRSIAVLPLASFSDRAGDRLLAERITDGVTTELARLRTLAVVSHTSALQFSGARPSMREIAATLGADFVLEASLQVEGDAVVVEARLVNAATDRKVWVSTFTGEARNIPGLQRSIAETVSAEAGRRAPYLPQ